ncbi:hypothetical protein PSHT_09649 [Puccinia striiformis]|uniref:Uncharacterized protein n=4 Tax=Puccinia striiformis TaxID=27350 RepID=A0A0L0VQ56_9BASI|nr:hypothetical protein PSTG_05205 [Puccinia striiformis f. sp. tritici PST-78]POW08178.1 hypothetical protein PSHT_09649 [Puccinia striiformis]POW08445.1 hypothetical protein PSTT_07524 [Puccinia striiformis]
MTLKAFSILLLVLILSPIASGQSGGRNPKRSCDQTGKLKFPICTTVTGKNADGTLKHGRAEPPGGGGNPNGFGCGNLEIRFAMCCDKKVTKDMTGKRPDTNNKKQCVTAKGQVEK